MNVSGEFLDRFEKRFGNAGKAVTAALMILVALATASGCLAVIFHFLIIPLYEVVGTLLRSDTWKAVSTKSLFVEVAQILITIALVLVIHKIRFALYNRRLCRQLEELQQRLDVNFHAAIKARQEVERQLELSKAGAPRDAPATFP